MRSLITIDCEMKQVLRNW